MPNDRVNLIVKEWISGDVNGIMQDAWIEDPENAWLAILEVLKVQLTEQDLALLAGGPLEGLLAWHGQDFIERMEREAHSNPRFHHLLGGVWRQDMPDSIWQRIVEARKSEW